MDGLTGKFVIALSHRRLAAIYHGPRRDARAVGDQCCRERGAVVGHGAHKQAQESGDGGLEDGGEDGGRDR